MALPGRILKYAAAVSAAAAALTAAHLVWLYLYLGSVPMPVSGGSLSVGVVGKAPSPDAMDPRPDSAAGLVMRLAFRGVLRYDPETGKVAEDLARCDVSKLSDVRCFMNENAVWDDGKPVTAHDVAATYAAYRSSVASARYADALSGATVAEGRNGSVRFSFPKGDLVSLETLFLPVFRAEDLAAAGTGALNLASVSHSGPFSLSAPGPEEVPSGEERVVMERNPAYSASPVRLARVILRFFPSEADLARARDTLHVVYSADPSLLSGQPRFAAHKYLLPQHYAFFLNTETVPLALRRALVSRVLPAAAPELSGADAAPARDAFLGAFLPPAFTGSDLASALASAGYLPKAERVRLARAALEASHRAPAATGVTVPAGSATGSAVPSLTGAVLPPASTGSSDVSTGAKLPEASVVPVTPVPAPSVPKAAFRKLVRFSNPSESPAFFSSGNMLLSGTVPAGTDQVRVNGYTLSKFAAGHARFYYRASVASKTLKEGRNEYVARFFSSGAETASETLVAYYSPTESGSAAQRAEWEKAEAPASAATGVTVPAASATGSAVPSLTGAVLPPASTGSSDVSTGAKLPEVPALPAAPRPAISAEAVPARSAEAEALGRALALPESGFYDAQFRPFSLSVAFPAALAETAQPFLDALDGAGIRVDVRDLDRAGMDALYQGANKDYDALLTGIGLGFFGYDLFPYFHSGQIERGYNFPKIRDQQADALLEKARASLRPDGDDVPGQLAKVLSGHAAFYPVHSPYQHLLVDRNIGGMPAFSSLPSSSSLADVFRGAWLRASRSPVLEGKSAAGFLRFLSGDPVFAK